MDHPRPLDGWDRNGRPLHYRILILNRPRGIVTIVAAAPRRIVDRPLAAAMTPLLVSLLLLGLFLAFALIVQVRVGLRPLRRLRDHLAAVRAGSARRIDVAEPIELLPLVAEINALIEANDQAVARARGHVANLAHGLKTPLATLRLDLAERDPTGALRAQVERMEGQIRHHLGRARAAELSNVAAALELEPRLADLVAALSRIHADRAITPQLDVEPGLHVRCDPQDLDELLGNLLDNGWRYAATRVRVVARRQGRMARIEISDDGPGMDDTEIAEALKGLRLDERGSGHGFGLSIARELAELHGGALDLARSDLGGLEAVVELPAI
jgi:signal transduction histidine kinase